MDIFPKDEPTAKIFFGIKALPIPEKSWKNLLGDGIQPSLSPLAIGGLIRDNTDEHEEDEELAIYW